MEGSPYHTYLLGFGVAEDVPVRAMHISAGFTGQPWTIPLEQNGLLATQRLLEQALAHR